MPSIILPRYLTEQPQTIVKPDRSHPAGESLIFAPVPMDGPVFFDMAIGAQAADPYNGDSFRTTGIKAEGRWRTTGGGGYRNSFSGPDTSISGNLGRANGESTTILLLRPKVSVGSNVRTLFAQGGNSSWNQCVLAMGDGTGNRFTGSPVTQSTDPIVSDNEYVVGDYYALAYTTDLINGLQRLFVNGVPQTDTGSRIDTTHIEINTWALGNFNASGLAEIYGAFVFNRVLSDSLIENLSRDYRSPWQVFEAPPRRLWVVPSSAGNDASATPAGVSASSVVGMATATGAANVSVSGVGAAASVGTATASGETVVPGWATPAGVSATATVGMATAAGSALVTVDGVSATASVGVASATGAEVVHGTASPAGVSVTASVGTVSLAATARALPAGVSVLASIGNPIASGEIHIDATALPAGVIAYTYIGQAIASDGSVPVYARAPSGSGYSPKRDERQFRPASRNQSRPANNQRNYR